MVSQRCHRPRLLHHRIALPPHHRIVPSQAYSVTQFRPKCSKNDNSRSNVVATAFERELNVSSAFPLLFSFLLYIICNPSHFVFAFRFASSHISFLHPSTFRFADYNRRKILNMIEPSVFKEYVYIKGHYEVLALRNKHKLRYQTMQRIRNGDY